MGSAQQDFGVVIPATSRHFHWLRGACASVRHFMGDTPICVLLDDDRAPVDVARTYGIQVMHRDEVEPRELREVSFSSRLRAKNAPLWVSPFETFLQIDCDAVVWGDMRSLVDFRDVDFLLDAGGREPLAAVMDIDAVRRHVPRFGAAAHVGDFVNTGAYFARRGALELDRYLELVELSERNPGMFRSGDQGLFNTMVFWAADEGPVRIRQREVQVVVGATSRDELVRRFGFRDSQPAVVGDPTVLHWAWVAKPRVREHGLEYFAPMTHFRREYRAAAQGAARWTDSMRLRTEDMLSADPRAATIRGRLHRLRRRLELARRRLKVRISARVRRR
jgi:hypothetical protein